MGEQTIDGDAEGATADDVVASIRDQVAQRLGFLVGGFVRRMSPLQFAQEATRRYNAAAKDNAPPPATCDDFLRMAVEKGFARVEGDA